MRGRPRRRRRGSVSRERRRRETSSPRPSRMTTRARSRAPLQRINAFIDRALRLANARIRQRTLFIPTNRPVLPLGSSVLPPPPPPPAQSRSVEVVSIPPAQAPRPTVRIAPSRVALPTRPPPPRPAPAAGRLPQLPLLQSPARPAPVSGQVSPPPPPPPPQALTTPTRPTVARPMPPARPPPPRFGRRTAITENGLAVTFGHDVAQTFLGPSTPGASAATPAREAPGDEPEILALTMGRSPPPYSPSFPSSSPPPPYYSPPPTYEDLTSEAETDAYESEIEIDDELAYYPDREIPKHSPPEVPLLCRGTPAPRWGKVLENSVYQECVVCFKESALHKIACVKCFKIIMCCNCHEAAFRSPYCNCCPLCRYEGPPPPPRSSSNDFIVRARQVLDTLDRIQQDSLTRTPVATSSVGTSTTNTPPQSTTAAGGFVVYEDDEVLIRDSMSTDSH